MHRIYAKIYPNNEIRITRSESKPIRVVRECDDRGEVDCEFLCEQELELLNSEESSLPPLSLGLNSKTQRSNAGYGELPARPTCFGLNAKRQLVRSGAALESVAPAEECLFLTGTLPGSTEDSYRTIAKFSGYIVNNLKAWISNYAPKKLDFYCWEYQRRGALHLHYCVHVPDRSNRDYILAEFKQWWIRCMSHVGERGLTDMFRKNSGRTWLSDTSKVRAVAEICRKSPARYLSKYLSKSSSPSRGSARAFTPSRWWGTSRPLKSLLNSLTSVIDISEGGYHAIRSVWEKVKHEWATSEGVTVGYQHKFGMGETLICYPISHEESECLKQTLRTLSTMELKNLSSQEKTPSKVLRTLRDQNVEWLRQSLQNLSDSHQGLKCALEGYLSMILRISPSKSEEPLKLLLMWAARASDIRSLSRYTSASTRESEKLQQRTLDALEWAISEVASNGWS